MLWLSVVGSLFYIAFFYLATGFYLLLHLSNTVFSFVLVLVAPLTHLMSYVARGIFIPVRFLGKFETLYIYLGTAALIGLVTGSILHFSSIILIRFLNLRPSIADKGRTAASVRAAREKRKSEDKWKNSAPTRYSLERNKMEDPLRDYIEYVDGHGKRKDGHGLLSQTILEEDDDSEAGF